MVWFIVQSLVIFVLTFLLGVLVGWMWWRRRKVQFSESDAAYVLLLDREAKVIWTTHRNVDDNAVAELLSHIAAVKQQTAR